MRRLTYFLLILSFLLVWGCTESDLPDEEGDLVAETSGVVDTNTTPDLTSPTPDLNVPQPDLDTDPPTDTADSIEPVPSPRTNVGFVGGPCTSHGDCDYEGGVCQFEADGFKGGHCTKVCTKFCPDSDKPGDLGTFCVNADKMGGSTDGLCVQKCNFGSYPDGGCPVGYHCEVLPRPDESARYGVCVVGNEPKWILSECQKELIERGDSFEIGWNAKTKEKTTGKTCDVVDPIYIGPYVQGVTMLTGGLAPKKMYARCALALQLSKALEYLNLHGATQLIHYGIYNCRTISGKTTLSQHAHGNAIDIAGVTVFDQDSTCTESSQCGLDGTCENNKCRYNWSVLDDWERGVSAPSSMGGIYLHDFAYWMHDNQIFRIILTPEYNEAHWDHFHVDLTPGAPYQISE